MISNGWHEAARSLQQLQLRNNVVNLRLIVRDQANGNGGKSQDVSDLAIPPVAASPAAVSRRVAP